MSFLEKFFRPGDDPPKPKIASKPELRLVPSDGNVSAVVSDGNGPNRRKQQLKSSRDEYFSRERIIATLEANLKVRDYLWRGRPNQVGISYRMYVDPIVKNANNIRVNPLVSNQAVWHVEPPLGATEYEQEAARFCQWMLTEVMDWRHYLGFAAKHRHMQGVSNVEFSDQIIELPRDPFPNHPSGMGIVVHKAVPIPPWSIKEYNPGRGQEAESMVQYVAGGGEQTLDMKQDLILRTAQEQEGKNFFGVPTLRAAYGDWSQKILMQVVRVLKHERFGLGTPVAKEPESHGVSDEQREKIADYLEQLRSNENAYMILPPGWEVEILLPSIEHGTGLTADIAAADIGIYSAFTNSVSNLGTGKFGSHALADTQDGHLDNAIEADASSIAAVINQGSDGWSLIKRYTALNYPGARPGRLRGSNFSQGANYKYMEMVERLVKAGVIRPFEEMETYTLEKLVAPKPSVPWDERQEVAQRQEIASTSEEEETQESSEDGGEGNNE